MSRPVAVALLVLVGCRQLLDIDEASVVPPADAEIHDEMPIGDVAIDTIINGNDEDEDGIPDAVDNCPTVENVSQSVLDGMIGTACDPRPEEGDRIALFTPFVVPGDAAYFDNAPGIVFANGHVNLDNANLRTMQPFQPTRVEVEFLVTSAALDGAVRIELSSNRCTLQACTGDYCLVAQSGANSSQTLFVPTGFRGVMKLDQFGPSLRCTIERELAPPVTAMVPLGQPQSTRVSVRSEQGAIEVDHLVIYDAAGP